MTSVADVRGGPSRLEVRTKNAVVLPADQVLLAFGRVPNTGDLGLEAAGVRLNERGAVEVGSDSRSSVASVYAVGDVTDRANLTPVAIREGHAFADSVFGGRPWTVDHGLIPTAVFTTPEAGTVGLTEAEARSRFPHVDIHRARHSPGVHVAGESRRALFKAVVEGGTGRVLGLHVVGDGAAEFIQAAAIAIGMGATLAQVLDVLEDGSDLEDLLSLRTPALSYRRAA